MRSDFDEQWSVLAGEVLSGMKAWRIAHPRASLSEIEQALDERLGRLRVRMVTDVALASEAVESAGAGCPACGGKVESRGQQERQLTSHANQMVRLQRSYGVCPACGTGFFPPG